MNKIVKVIVPLLLAALIIASIGWYLFIYDRSFTLDMLLQQARYTDSKGNTKLSSFFYDLAYDFSGQNENVAIELANQYKADGNYTKAEYTLVNAIADSATVELYAALCNTYVEQNKILDAVNMLESISNPALKAQLDALRPAAPTADYEDGFYNEYISVSLNAGEGTIYYTLDGDYPSMTSTIYAEAIPMELGETTIRSVCIGTNGLVSRVSQASFTIGGIVEQVVFADPAVEAAIRELLNVSVNSDIYTNELWGITEFECPKEAVVLTDLAYLPDLKTISFADMTLESLDCLQSLIALESVSFTGCRFPVEDLAIVASLPYLNRLTLDNCGLSTISDLAAARNLTYLNINNNTIRNLEVLVGMTGLQELHMAHNALTSLNALTGMTNLIVLDVSSNSLTSVSPLASCVRLQKLNVSNNQLSDLNCAGSLVCLTELHADYNKLTDVSVLGGCTGLTDLTISNNAIEDITAFVTLTALEDLDFSYNQVSALPEWTEGALRNVNGAHNQLENIDVLAKHANLAYVYMDYNNISSVDALENCYYLVLVNIYGNPVKDVSALTQHDIIVNFDPIV